MRSRCRLPAVVLGLAMASAAGAQEGEEAQVREDFLRLLSTRVITATKELRQVGEVPAVVSVITGEELRRSGAVSVGEALSAVPGLYGTSDFLGVNLGVRGINGGLRAYGRIVKVMIDNQPVAFRSDSANYLGPELIPIELVERIEVVRGPASALYGANAFLGVVNILTRTGGPRLVALWGERLLGHTGLGLEAVASAGGQRWAAAFGVSGSETDRSGHELPDSSPILRVTPPSERVSRNDLARPRSVYGRGWFQAREDLRLEVSVQASRLDTDAEWLDFGTLSHQNRVVLDQGFARVSMDWAPRDRWSLRAFLARSQGQPGGAERLSSGSATSYPRRELGFRAWDAGVEGRAPLGAFADGVLGVDVSSDDERLINVYTVTPATGTEVLTSKAQGRERFLNWGVYGQVQVHPRPGLGLTANLRWDHHNLYGQNTTLRLGAVQDLGAGVTAKVLYGTSFKAPAALQLYAQPLYAGEMVGNPGLRPETARTLEGELRWRAGERLALSLNGFRNRVSDKVESVPFGTNQRPENVGSQRSTGLEGEANLVRGVQGFRATLAYQRTDDVRVDPFRGEVSAPSSYYPGLVTTFRWQVRLSREARLEALLEQVGPRRASKSNIEKNYLTPYALGGYALADLAYLGRWGPHRVQARVHNLLDRRFAEPGARGYDIPGLRREWTFAYAYCF